MTRSFNHKKYLQEQRRIKRNLMQSFFRFYQIYKDRDTHRLVMDKRKGKMGHMVAGLMQGIGQTGMI